MSVQDVNISRAARMTGIPRRTIQRWIADGLLAKNEKGNVRLRELDKVAFRARKRGRPLRIEGRRLGADDCLSVHRASPFCTKSHQGLRSLRKMLEEVAFFYVHERQQAFIDALADTVGFVNRISERRSMYSKNLL